MERNGRNNGQSFCCGAEMAVDGNIFTRWLSRVNKPNIVVMLAESPSESCSIHQVPPLPQSQQNSCNNHG